MIEIECIDFIKTRVKEVYNVNISFLNKRKFRKILNKCKNKNIAERKLDFILYTVSNDMHTYYYVLSVDNLCICSNEEFEKDIIRDVENFLKKIYFNQIW